MKAALKYPVFYLAPAEHMVYVFWREENVTTRRLLAEADGWAGQEVIDASGAATRSAAAGRSVRSGSTAVSARLTDAPSATTPTSKRRFVTVRSRS